MLTIYQTNRLDLLKSLLFKILQINPSTNPLDTTTVIVDNHAVANWLVISIASEFKIATGIKFITANDFLWNTYRKVIPQLTKDNPFNKLSLSWSILNILDKLIAQPEFKSLKEYIETDKQVALRKYQLAQNIADLFINYTLHRADMLINWEKKHNKYVENTENIWQPILWRELIQEFSSLHLATAAIKFTKDLTTVKQNILPKNILLFGISSLTSTILKSLYLLAKNTNVHLFATNPCKYYWGDYAVNLKKQTKKTTEHNNKNITTTSHILLDTMARVGRDFFNNLHETEAVTIDAFAEDFHDHLLGKIQFNIFHLINQQQEPLNIATTDDSLTIHNCHSKLRELQVLHDRLLFWFDKNPKLTPKDILIVAPDINSYNSWINATFNSYTLEDDKYIPFSIYSATTKNTGNYADIILQILKLDTNRCIAEDILAFLAIKPIRTKFDIAKEDINIIRNWVKKLNIRWGLNKSHCDKFVIKRNNINTWEFGLERLLLGHAFPEYLGVFQQMVASDYASHQNADLIGKLADFLTAIIHIENSCPSIATIDDWIIWINTSIASISEEDEIKGGYTASGDDHLAKLAEVLEIHNYKKTIDKSILYSYLNDKLHINSSKNYMPNGKLTFANLQDMSVIPFKIICFLGMNGSDFPLHDTPVDFNLINKHPQAGDEQLKDKSRYCFLQTFLAAEDKVYISFVGQNINDNTEKLPSIVVEEILEYCKFAFNIENKQLIIKHPLQPFSKNNFQQIDSKFFSYASHWITNDNIIKNPQQTTQIATTITDIVELHKLIACFKNPVKYFLNQQLGVFFDDPEDFIPDTEPFSLDGLEKYKLKEKIIETSYIQKSTTENIRNSYKHVGVLPQFSFGDYVLNDIENSTSEIIKNLTKLQADLTTKTSINIKINSPIHKITKINAEIKGLNNNQLVCYFPSSEAKGKHLIDSWLQHLCCCTQQETTTNLLFESKHYYFKPLTQQQALDYLNSLLEIYETVLLQPIPWFADLAYVWGKKLKRDFTEHTNDSPEMLSACKNIIADYMTSTFNMIDALIDRVYPNFFEQLVKFNDLTKEIMLPILHNLQEFKLKKN